MPNWYRWTVKVDQAVQRFKGWFTFLALEDTPDSYSGQALKLVRVNAGANALEFFAFSAGSITLTNTHILVGNASNVATDVAMSGDATLANTGAISVTKTGGVSFGYFATGTDAANLTGTLASARLVGSYTGITGVGTLTAGVWHATIIGLAYGGTGADLSATGGTSQFLKQASAGAVVTVAQVTDADLSTSDITTNNVSTSKHGFAPKLPNDNTKFLDGTGAYSTPAGAGTVTTTGSPASGNLTKFSGATSVTNGDLSGDISTSGTLVTTIKTDVALAGNPTTTTQTAGDSSTKIATTAFVQSAVTGGGTGSLYPAFTTPDNTQFSWVNQGGASVTVNANGGIFLNAPASASNSIRARVKSLPGGNYTLIVAFYPALVAQNNVNCGICLQESSSGKLINYSVFSDQTFTDNGFVKQNFTNSTTFSASTIISAVMAGTGLVFMKLDDNGTNRTWSFSRDGYNYIQLHQETRTTFLTADKAGFFCNTQASSWPAAMTLMSWAGV